jgi:HEAT repeat protein
MERYFLSPIADPGMIPLLASYGKDATPLLERLLHRSYEESCRAALLITELGDTVHYDEMEDYGENNLCLAWNLARLQPERARPLMLAHLSSNNPMDRRQAVYSLESIGDSSYLPLLRELTRDTDALVSSNAAFALGSFGDTSGAEILRKAARDTESVTGQNAERLLSQLPEALIAPVLYPLLSADHGAATQRAAKAAGELHDFASVPYLLELLKIEDLTLQLYVLDALGEIGMTDAREPVRGFLDSEDIKLKTAAMLAAGALKDTAVVGRLNLMLFWEVGPWEETGWIRHPIVDALAMIGDTSALPALALTLNDGDPYLSIKVLGFFREHASSDYIPYVEPFLQSPVAPLRIEAAAAILAMAER